MIHYTVVAHHTRETQACNLAAALNAELFMDNMTLGATFNHLQALNWAATKTGHVIVLEDDALPVRGFKRHVTELVEQFPNDLVSLYLGTGRPPQYQALITAKLEEADHAGRNWIELPQLVHAVAYIIPCTMIRHLTVNTRKAADFALGTAWVTLTGQPIVYTIPSYVEHTDGPSIANPHVTVPRRARRLAG